MFNYEHLALLGTHYPLKFKLSQSHKVVKNIEEKFEFLRYNPRKNYT